VPFGTEVTASMLGRSGAVVRALVQALEYYWKRFSDNYMDKRTRGRPKLFDADMAAMLRKLGEIPETATARTLQNWLYFGHGVTAATSSPALKWLLPGGSCYKRKTLLSQLGRVKNAKAREVFALRLCELQPTTQDGIRLLRRWHQTFRDIAAMYIVDNEPVDVLKIANRACKSK
jgi:hypothetical protein